MRIPRTLSSNQKTKCRFQQALSFCQWLLCKKMFLRAIAMPFLQLKADWLICGDLKYQSHQVSRQLLEQKNKCSLNGNNQSIWVKPLSQSLLKRPCSILVKYKSAFDNNHFFINAESFYYFVLKVALYISVKTLSIP